MSDPEGLSIGELARRTGVPAATLRSWEDRYDFPRPERMAGGHRRYAESDSGRIEEIRAYYASPQDPSLKYLELGGFDYAGRGYPLAAP